MNPKHFLLLLPLVLTLCLTTTATTTAPKGFSRLGDKLKFPNMTLEHLDPTLPPVLPGQTPRCSVLVLQHDFANTIGAPPAAANYSQPPDCPAPWTRIVLELSVSASAIQKDRIAAIWIDGVEVLRTTTPVPMSPGAFWKVTKDITRYASAVRRLADYNGVVSMMLENSNTELPGVYSASISIHFYRGAVSTNPNSFSTHPTIKGLYKEPADLIIPVTNENGFNKAGFWFTIQNEADTVATSIQIPTNTYRAVLELFVSYHGDDEFWYNNPLRSSYLDKTSNPKLSTPRTNGAFRQVFAAIDGKFVGGHIPIVVIYPGSINPFFWSPVAAIAAFDMPSYDLDITPFLGMLLDGRPHEFSFGVHDSQPYWLVGANLHVWVDVWSDVTQAGLMDYNAPPLKVNRNAAWRNQDGQSEIDAEGLLRFIGWVSSSKGNLTTVVRQKIKFKSQVEVQNRGAVKQVEMINKGRMTVALMKGNQGLARVQLMVDAPMQVQTSSVNTASGAVFQKTRLYHQLQEIVELSEGQAVSVATLTDRQDADGSALLHEGEAVWGNGATRSSYKFRDDTTCYIRAVNTAGGLVQFDTTSGSCLKLGEEGKRSAS
ncbi:Peptide-N4-(N-acetyl-beta-glucosaminyl)asparagine amidase A protein [Dioscorea alata]|uniref:Peptide-N4-(N-acetyl-beta-glucosaminyl)asparagine amidase A protein n=1 Tax=Dioscorea alata TaxID=55571 RepID=A0ACB7V2U2_DIOAL|nr:Peptide-N4-(N-acetyl-beta-glucosaminyl)asparagine amidase A protein [Dioscorea alata]